MPDGKFRKLLNKVDLYGLSFPLRYKAHHEYNTLCGVTLSLLTILIITIVVLIFFVNTMQRSSVSVIHNSEQLYDKKILNFSRVPLLIGFINDGGRPVEIDPKYIKITLDKNDHYPEKNKEGIMHLRRESTSIKLEYCDLNKHFNNDSEIIKMINEFEYDKYLCVVPGQNLSIAGRFGDSIHGYDMLEIHLIKCENTSTYNECATSEEMETFYTNSYMSILYLSEALEHHDSKNPIRKTFRSEVFMIVSNSVKRYYYYFAPGEYISDNGFVFQSNESFEFFEYQNTQLDFVDEEDQSYYSGQTLIEVSFSSVDKFVTYERSYSKIQDSLGNIGGWIRIILTVCQLVSNYFSEKIFLLDIINKISFTQENKTFHIFNSKKESKENNKNNDKDKDYIKTNNFIISNDFTSKNKIQLSRTSIKTINLKDMNINKVSQNNELTNNVQLSNEEIKPSFTIKRRKKIRLNYCDYILPFGILEKYEKFSFIILYKNFIYKNISLEVMIPLTERLSKILALDNKNNYLSKISHTFLSQTNTNNNNKKIISKY